MGHTFARLTLCLAAALLLAIPASTQGPAPPRIVAVGDIHGAIDELRALLRRIGLTDETGAWTGGARTALVQTGDFTDRGTGTRAVMDLLIELEQRAAAAGAKVHVLLGNHETMNLLGEMQDVTPAIFATFADERSEERREEAWRRYEKFMAARASRLGAGTPRPRSREAWLAEHPPGYFEYRAAFEPDGHYGRWLRSLRAIAQLGDSIFLHGGLHPQMAPSKIDDLNKQVEREIRQWDEYRRQLIQHNIILPFFSFQEVVEAARVELQGIAAAAQRGEAPAEDPRLLNTLQGIVRIGTWAIVNPNGPLWFRGYATWSSAEGQPQIATLLQKYKARRFIVGHTILSSMRITPRFDKGVFLIDTGMLASHYMGRASALEITGNRITALYQDGRVVLDGMEADHESDAFGRSGPGGVPRAAKDTEER